MKEFRQVWTTLAEHISKVVERTRDLPADQLRLLAALACLAFFLVLIAWVGTLRKLRTTTNKLDKAQARSEELQVKYDAEARWRTATERVQAAKTEQIASAPAATPEPAQQLAGVVDSTSDQKQEIGETGTPRKANALRVLSLVMSCLALVGWGAFGYAAKSSATAQHQLREEVAHLKAIQDQLLAERDQAKAQAAAVQQELAMVQKRREERSETGSAHPTAPSEKPVRSPAQTKRESR